MSPPPSRPDPSPNHTSQSDFDQLSTSERHSPSSLSVHLIPGPPPSMYYIPNFVSESESTSLLTSASSVPLPQWRHLSHRRLQSQPSPLSAQNVLLDAPLPHWLQWPADRISALVLEDLPAHPTSEKDEAANDALFSREQDIEVSRAPKTLFSDSPHGKPNHCLVNEYLPGQGIMPHEDGPAYHPITATISLGSHAVLEVHLKPTRDADDGRPGDDDPVTNIRSSTQQQLVCDEDAPQTSWRILCEPRSLLVTTGEAYVRTLHAIAEVEVDEGVVEPGSVKRARGVANWGLLGEREGWVRDAGRRRRETRVSLTYRDVVKVRSMKAFGGLKGFGRR